MSKINKLNVLISAYYCDPTRGSEESVGWNFSKTMAHHHNVWVLTKESNRKVIEHELNKNPISSLNFVYFDFRQNRIFNEKALGEQISYIYWELLALSAYRTIAKKIKFDLIHHLTFNQYRSPSIGFFINKPFIMGPVGGAESIDPVFFQDLTSSTQKKERWRTLGLDKYLFGFLAKLRSNSKTFIFSSIENENNLKKHLGKKQMSICIPAIAINKADFINYTRDKTIDTQRPFTIIYAGTAKDWKGLSLFLRSIKNAFGVNDNVLIKLIGIRNDDENKKVMDWIGENDLSQIVTVTRFMPRIELINELSAADLSVYPAFRDSGSMSVLEGCALGCPVICFDAGGQDVFPDDIMIKIPISKISYQDNVINFSNKLQWAFSNRPELNKIGLKARDYVFEYLTWEKKVLHFCSLYNEIIARI